MRVIDRDALTGIETLFHYDEATDRTVLEYRQPFIQEQLDYTEKLRQHAWDNRTDRKADGMGNLYAHIPDWVQLKWANELGVKVWDKNDWKKVIALINSPEWSKLKVAHWNHTPK
jgi:16S rRNA C967 or C1407 C5-methylase (RsmB/RsmF family)